MLIPLKKVTKFIINLNIVSYNLLLFHMNIITSITMITINTNSFLNTTVLNINDKSSISQK